MDAWYCLFIRIDFSDCAATLRLLTQQKTVSFGHKNLVVRIYSGGHVGRKG